MKIVLYCFSPQNRTCRKTRGCSLILVKEQNGLDVRKNSCLHIYICGNSKSIVVHVMEQIVMIFCEETIRKYVSIPSTSRAGSNKPRLPSSAIAKQPVPKRRQLQHCVTRNYDSFMSENH